MLFFIISQDLGQWERLGGAVNPIFFGIFSFLLSVVSFYLSFHERIKVIKASLWIASLIFMVASVLTQSRGVIIAYVPIIFLVCMYLFFSRSWRLKEFFVPLVILVAIGAWSLYQGNLLNRFSQMFNEMDKVTTQTEKNDSVFRTSIGHRIMVWSYSWDVALENPVFGVGNKRYQELKVEWAENSRYPKALAESLPGSHAHSQYFQEIALRGFIGLFSLAFLFLYPLYFGVKFIRLNDRSTHYAGYMLVSIVIGFVVFSLSEVALKHPDKIAMFVIFNFLAVRLCQESAAVEKRPAI
jgi:O-antigen ligase